MSVQLEREQIIEMCQERGWRLGDAITNCLLDREHAAGFTPEEVRASFEEIIGPRLRELNLDWSSSSPSWYMWSVRTQPFCLKETDPLTLRILKEKIMRSKLCADPDGRSVYDYLAGKINGLEEKEKVP